MKVLLINPPTFNMISAEAPSLVTEERGYNPPLGIMYIAAHLRENSTAQVEILDTQVEEMNYSQIKEEIEKRNPNVIGLSAMTFTLLDCMEVAKLAKKINPAIKIVLGGVHVNAYPNETIAISEVDFLVLGEGEENFTDLINNLNDFKKLKEIAGLVFIENEEIIHTGKRPLIQDLDLIPFPARDLTPYKKYSSLLAKRNPITTMITSRGCPYNCSFCDRPHLGKIFRARSAQNVLKEIEECVAMGIGEILVYDDTFTIDKQRVIDICDGIIQRKLDITFDIRARVDTVDSEMLLKLKKAGCARIHYGVEAGNQEILNILKKGITLEQVEKAFKLTRKIGIEILAYFMIGSPKETEKTVMESINFAKSLKPDFAHFTITTPFPTSDLYYLGLEQGILKNDYWKEFAKNPTISFKPEIWEENLKRDDIERLLKKAYKSFYLTPRFMFKEAKRIKSFKQLHDRLKIAMRLLKS